MILKGKGVKMLNDAGAVNPFDTTAEENELNALNAELEQARASLEGDFAKYAAENTSAELEELFFEDKEEFFKTILQMQNKFLSEGVGAKEARANQLTADINQKKQFSQIEEAKNAFEAKYPEISVETLLSFYQEALPPKIVAQLEALPPEQFFEELYNIYKAMNGEGETKQEEQGEKLPQQISGAPQSSEAASGAGSELPFQRL